MMVDKAEKIAVFTAKWQEKKCWQVETFFGFEIAQ